MKRDVDTLKETYNRLALTSLASAIGVGVGANHSSVGYTCNIKRDVDTVHTRLNIHSFSRLCLHFHISEVK